MSPRTIATVFVGTILTALASCGGAGGMTGSEGADSTSTDTSSGPMDSASGDSDDGTSTPDVAGIADMGLEACLTEFCQPFLLGNCGPPELCDNDGFECSFSHDFSSLTWPTRCAVGSEVRHGEHESCETMDSSGLQTCETGMACIGPAGDELGSCHTWCGGVCTTAGDFCIDLTFPESSIGGFCARSCNPLDEAPCSHTGQSLCVDVLGQSGISSGTKSRFLCIPSHPGPVNEREPCDVTYQHNPIVGGLEDAACAPGLTCANYQFADQPFRSLQCLRVCDAPEDCAPTEVCVSNPEYTEAVGAPIGVCEAM